MGRGLLRRGVSDFAGLLYSALVRCCSVWEWAGVPGSKYEDQALEGKERKAQKSCLQLTLDKIRVTMWNRNSRKMRLTRETEIFKTCIISPTHSNPPSLPCHTPPPPLPPHTPPLPRAHDSAYTSPFQSKACTR